MSKNKDVTGHIQWGRMLKKLNPYTIKKGLRYFKHYGPKEFWIRLHERFEPEEVPYGPWYDAYVPDEKTLEKQRTHQFAYAPQISVAVPAYQTPTEFLKQMIDSLMEQTYSNWELCIANASPDNEEMQRVLSVFAHKQLCLQETAETPDIFRYCGNGAIYRFTRSKSMLNGRLNRLKRQDLTEAKKQIKIK